MPAEAPSSENLDVVRAFFDLMHRQEIDVWGELWNDDGQILVAYPPDAVAASADS
jgi:hypothetical protein